MTLDNQIILPALRNMKDFEKLLDSPYEYIVLLDLHIGNLKNITTKAKQHKKKVLLHADLIHGLKADDYGIDYLCHQIQPEGIISTRANVISKAKEKGLLAIQRLFLLDSSALNKGCALIEKTKPDYIELLPGIIPEIIQEVHLKVKIPIFAGGFIRTTQDVESAISAGVKAVTTSNKELWKHYTPIHGLK